jgi:hypothetical protein
MCFAFANRANGMANIANEWKVRQGNGIADLAIKTNRAGAPLSCLLKRA